MFHLFFLEYLIFFILQFQLLRRPVNQRLGSGPEDAEAIKRHSFFKNVNWDDVMSRKLKPPYSPELVNVHSLSCANKNIAI